MQRRQGSNGVEETILVVSNSSVIIALARICRLDLLEKLFKEIVISQGVWEEVTVESKPGREKIVRAGFIHVKKASNGYAGCSSTGQV